MLKYPYTQAKKSIAINSSCGNRSFLQEQAAGVEKMEVAAQAVLDGGDPVYYLSQAARYAQRGGEPRSV